MTGGNKLGNHDDHDHDDHDDDGHDDEDDDDHDEMTMTGNGSSEVHNYHQTESD